MNKLKRSLLLTVAIGGAASSFAQSAPNGWHLKDKTKDGYYGISLDKAYDFVKGKKSQTVLVAVIDSGIDTTHEDLKPILWVNTKEIPGNGKDDDKNGYVDDINGWNFIGGKDGRNVKEDSYEVTRVYHRYKAKYGSVTDFNTLPKEEQATYKEWKRAVAQVNSNGGDPSQLLILSKTYEMVIKNDSILRKAIGKDVYTGSELDAYAAATEDVKKAQKGFVYFFKANNSMDMTNKSFIDEFGQYLAGEEKKAAAADKAPDNYRGNIVKDNEADLNDRFYGNNDVMANTPFHGTHVSGIIAAARKNGKGMDGIADNVRIMTIRAVPDGDEHDKDIALAIRYAVDNGAKIINMSFGKGFSPEKNWVDDAVKYAETKGVLLIHAAGNDASNVDTVNNFPNPVFVTDKKKASNWLTVGASGDPKNGGLVATFSNYGKSEVDVFAPGHQIYSTVPGGTTYGNASGTSMASPVTAGVAAFLLSYYPTLTAQQLKYAIEKSAMPHTGNVKLPGSDKSISLSELSKTGGVINAFEAAKVAAQLTGKNVHVAHKKPVPQKKPAKKPMKTF